MNGAAPILSHQHRRRLISKLLSQQAAWLSAEISPFPPPSSSLPPSLSAACLACIHEYEFSLGVNETDRNTPVPLPLGRILFSDVIRVTDATPVTPSSAGSHGPTFFTSSVNPWWPHRHKLLRTLVWQHPQGLLVALSIPQIRTYSARGRVKPPLNL